MRQFLQSTAAGLAQGSVYALLALGFVIVYKSTRVISFAQPGLMAFGAWWVIYFGAILDWGFWPAVLVSVLVTATMAAGIERIAIRPMVGQPVFAAAIVTIGLDIILRTVVNDLLGSNVRSLGDPWGLETVRIGGVVVRERWIAMVVAMAAVGGVLILFFKRTRMGLAMRATSFDQEASLAQGVSVGRVFGLSWAIAGGLAAIAGIFVEPGGGFTQQSAFIALKALPALVVGGLESLGGAVVGGLLIGLLEGYSFTYQTDLLPALGQNFSQVVPYLIMLVVLLIRPYGLFGTREVERV